MEENDFVLLLECFCLQLKDVVSYICAAAIQNNNKTDDVRTTVKLNVTC